MILGVADDNIKLFSDVYARNPPKLSSLCAQATKRSNQLAALFEHLHPAITGVPYKDEAHRINGKDFWLSELAFPLPYGAKFSYFVLVCFVVDFYSSVPAVQNDDSVVSDSDAGWCVQFCDGHLSGLPVVGRVCCLKFSHDSDLIHKFAVRLQDL